MSWRLIGAFLKSSSKRRGSSRALSKPQTKLHTTTSSLRPRATVMHLTAKLVDRNPSWSRNLWRAA